MDREYFTMAQAHALVGRRIRTLVPWSEVPEETEGTVTQADPTASADGWMVGIQWDLENRVKPLVDWFTRDEYAQYLEELTTEDEAT